VINRVYGVYKKKDLFLKENPNMMFQDGKRGLRNH
jgi:hypothetical protein